MGAENSHILPAPAYVCKTGLLSLYLYAVYEFFGKEQVQPYILPNNNKKGLK